MRQISFDEARPVCYNAILEESATFLEENHMRMRKMKNLEPRTQA